VIYFSLEINALVRDIAASMIRDDGHIDTFSVSGGTCTAEASVASK